MAIRQTRIFVPHATPYDNTETWYETLLGRVIQPLVQKHHSLSWFFFSHYIQTRADSGDCDVIVVPKEFEVDGLLRSTRFRFEIPDGDLQSFEQDGRQLINNEACVISDWRDYNLLQDLGGDRFIGETRNPRRRDERVKLVMSYLNTISKLVLHSLIGPDSEGRFRPERNDDRQQNPLESSFESMHHMFCNITRVPLQILVFSDGSQTFIGTNWYGPQQAGWRIAQKIRTQY